MHFSQLMDGSMPPGSRILLKSFKKSKTWNIMNQNKKAKDYVLGMKELIQFDSWKTGILCNSSFVMPYTVFHESTFNPHIDS